MFKGQGEEDFSHDVCAICRGVFKDPKFLPCFHTYCAACIEGLARHCPKGSNLPEGDFPCPTCRKVTSLPRGGVASLQTNFYIKDLPPATSTCQVHSKRLEFFCVRCEQAICLNCKLTRHEHHETDDLASTISRKKDQLQSGEKRLQDAVSTLKERVTSLIQERQSLVKKKAMVGETICNRYSFVVDALHALRDEELRSLTLLYRDLDQLVRSRIEQKKNDVADLSHLQQQVTDALASGTDNDIITVEKEMRTGRGSQQAVDALTKDDNDDRLLHRPVLHFTHNIDTMLRTARDYLGSVCMMEMRQTPVEVSVTKVFQCALERNVDVFSLCHIDRNPPEVVVSFTQQGKEAEDASTVAFTEAGETMHILSDGRKLGRVSTKRYTAGKSMFVSSATLDRTVTYCKSLKAHLVLDNKLTGQASVQRDVVTSRHPFKAEKRTEFRIHVGPHRAFDVDDTEQYFAVVEEAGESSSSSTFRRVLLYRRSAKKPVATYHPPVPKYQPSDVCFYTLKGHKVLLITDELNDAVHVVSVQGDGTLRFQRYLSAGCPSLHQPMAINVDVHDRLWVGCRGGAVLLIEQIM
ncbi:tripartite motif-containing protein 2-like [Babylonia areolata]|uniref:tripartite motif-containing protein 2-like n=1 Tax=Babylonia areolata TaxID=304850 RepID=UPI003FCF22C7